MIFTYSFLSEEENKKIAEIETNFNRFYIVSYSELVNFYSTEMVTYAANSAAKTVQLNKTQKTATTKRILVNQNKKHAGLHMNVDIRKFGKRGTLVYTLFQDGEYYQTYVAYDKGNEYHSLNLLHGEYSLRLYCGNPSNLEKGCVADGSLEVFYGR